MNEHDVIRSKIKHCKEVADEYKDETPAPVIEVVDTLVDISTLLMNKLEKLENKVNKTSRNSSKPPSTDQSRSHRSNRTGRGKVGGQKGHKGYNLKKKVADKVIKLKAPKGKCSCGQNLCHIDFKNETRQVQDIVIKSFTKDYIGQCGSCICGKVHRSSYPEGVNAPVQYGELARAFAVYLKDYQLVPFDRVEEIMQDFFGLSMSEGTVFNYELKASDRLEEFENKAIEGVLNCKVGHADETTIVVNRLKHYLHVFSNESITLLFHHANRGFKAMNDIGILKRFEGVLVHDSLRMYMGLDCRHALCNAHLIRELTWVEEIAKIRWGHELRVFLEDSNELVKEWKKTRRGPSLEGVDQLTHEFTAIMNRGARSILSLEVNGGRGAQDPSYNLYMRIKNNREAVLRFISDWDVPFTNNMAERDLRMSKVHQKISGGFRTIEGAKKFARIRSFISTIKKQKKNVLEGLQSLFRPKNNYINDLLGVTT